MFTNRPLRAAGRVGLGPAMGIDLGTSNTRVHVRGRGIVLDEPTVVAIDSRTGAVLAVGHDARAMIGRAPGHIRVVRPIVEGIIHDFDVTERMLRYFLRQVGRRGSRPRVVVCVPVGTTGIERRAAEEAALQAGARTAQVMEEPMAAAIGVGLPVQEPAGSMVIDMGGGITEVAVVSLGGVVASESVRVGGDTFDAAIVAHVKSRYRLIVGVRTAGQVKIAIGSALPTPGEPSAEVRGRDLVSGLPHTVILTAEEVREAMDEALADVVEAVSRTLDATPPELAADIIDHGMVLTGGSGLLTGMDARLATETGMRVHVTDHPMNAVARGAASYLEEVAARRIA